MQESDRKGKEKVNMREKGTKKVHSWGEHMAIKRDKNVDTQIMQKATKSKQRNI